MGVLLILLPLLAIGGVLLEAQPTSRPRYTLTPYPPQVVQGNAGSCPTEEDREGVRNQIREDIREIIAPTGPTPPSTPCGPGWTRVAFLNMSDLNQNCPSPWTETVSGYPSSNRRVCYRHQSSGGSCDSVTYVNTGGAEYNQVCGRIIGYQYYNTHGFYPYEAFSNSIDTFYVDGISVTHGQPPRMHIWTFAAGHREGSDIAGSCPCDRLPGENPSTVPPYVGNNYFCESGNNQTGTDRRLYTEDPLWDGMGCGAGRQCECTLNSPPWFMAQLPNPTTDNIEVRSCSYQGTSKNVGIELIELYVN